MPIIPFSIMKSLLESYLNIVKDLKKKGELNPNDDKFMDEIYDKLTDMVCLINGENYREQTRQFIQKRFEEEIL